MADSLSKEVKEFLKANQETASVLENGKSAQIRCSVTGHELSAKIEDLQAHWTGKKFRQCQRKKAADLVDLDKYKPYLSQHKKFSDKVYCSLTGFTLNKNINELELHVNGRRYKAALRVRGKAPLPTADEEEEGEEESEDDDAALLEEDLFDRDENTPAAVVNRLPTKKQKKSAAAKAPAEPKMPILPDDVDDGFEVVPARDSDNENVDAKVESDSDEEMPMVEKATSTKSKRKGTREEGSSAASKRRKKRQSKKT